METATIMAAGLGWSAGCLFMWWYMLRVCDQEHAKVLKLEAELALQGNFNDQMAAEIVEQRIAAKTED